MSLLTVMKILVWVFNLLSHLWFWFPDIETNFLPWLMAEVNNSLEKRYTARELLDSKWIQYNAIMLYVSNKVVHKSCSSNATPTTNLFLSQKTNITGINTTLFQVTGGNQHVVVADVIKRYFTSPPPGVIRSYTLLEGHLVVLIKNYRDH